MTTGAPPQALILAHSTNPLHKLPPLVIAWRTGQGVGSRAVHKQFRVQLLHTRCACRLALDRRLSRCLASTAHERWSSFQTPCVAFKQLVAHEAEQTVPGTQGR